MDTMHESNPRQGTRGKRAAQVTRWTDDPRSRSGAPARQARPRKLPAWGVAALAVYAGVVAVAALTLGPDLLAAWPRLLP